ncbi:MAG: HNH endonuclease [Sideroxyarcus sp.]
MAISPEQVAAAYEIASRVFDGKYRPEVGAKELNIEHGLNINSARDFIGQYRSLMHGAVFKRTMTASHMEYFLSQILLHRGNAAAELALSSAWKHVEYYEALQKTTQRSFRSVLEAFKRRIAEPGLITTIETQFATAVSQSLRDSAAARRLRLQNANKIPGTVSAATKIYVRNPDVVAEVLFRANGLCEQCKKPAPFIRRTDGSPYLEVHHKVLLSVGGEDSVENAIALCPNCHRYKHFA